MDADDPAMSYIPFDQVTAAKGMVTAYHDYWWSVHPERGLLIWKRRSPQCNMNMNVALHLHEKLYPWAEVRRIPLVLVPHNCNDY